MIDKFTKWIEAKPITRVRSKDAVEFFLDIVYRLGVLNSIITNNGTLFTGKKLLDSATSTAFGSTRLLSLTRDLMAKWCLRMP